MLAPRDFFARPLAIGLLAVSICLAGASGCHGPDTFLRNDGTGGRPLGGFSGQLGGADGLGGAGGITTGEGGSGSGGAGFGGAGAGGIAGTGGRPGTGGIGAGGRVDGGMAAGGRMGTGGATDGGMADVPGVGGMMATGGAPGMDAGNDVNVGTGPCAPFCAPTTTVVTFTVGAGYHTPASVPLTEACFETISNVQGANCSNFTGRTLTVNGTAEPNCGTNFSPPARVNGGYCFQFSAGTPGFAQVAVF